MTAQPDLTPDRREEKLPVWVQEQFQMYRRTITDLRGEVALLKGELPDSNVMMLEKAGLGKTPLPKNAMIKFASKSWGGITVHHERDGRLRIQGDNTLILRMNAGNALTVELEEG